MSLIPPRHKHICHEEKKTTTTTQAKEVDDLFWSIVSSFVVNYELYWVFTIFFRTPIRFLIAV